MVNIKFQFPLPNARLPNLPAWIYVGFLLAAVDRARVAEGQTVRSLPRFARKSVKVPVADQQYSRPMLCASGLTGHG
jgi:hypothetical protein